MLRPYNARLGRSGLESGVDGFTVFGGKSHLDVLLTQLFMNEGNRVIAWRKPLDLELAIGAGDGEEGTLGYVDEHAHPGMLVALDRQHDFFAGKGFLERGGLGRLRLVPLAVILGGGMDVVGGGIAVDDLD